MDSAIDYWSAKALLDWQIEMGADEAIADAPVDRYALQDKKPEPPKPKEAAAPPPPAKALDVDVVQEAREAAAAAQSLDGLYAALDAFEHCPLKAAARHTIFADGVAGSDVMILTDPPDRDDDRAGKLLSGPAGMLFDKMIAAIGLARATVYVAPVLPWRPPQNRDPNVQELAMMRPFLNRHIELAGPKVLVLMGNGPCQAMLDRSGMTRMRGKWAEAAGLPALPMFAPAYLMGTPAAKRDAWADLLSLKARLKEIS